MTDKDKQLEALRKELEQSRALNRNLSDALDKAKHEKIANSNFDFVQMYRKQVKQLRRLGIKNGLALNILLMFTEKMNKQNAIMISHKALQQITGRGKTQISTAMKLLKEEQFVKVIKVGTANAYLVNSDIFWRNSAKLKDKIAIFNARVIATGSEQEQTYFENWENIKLQSMPMFNQDEVVVEAETGKIEEFTSDIEDFELEQQKDGE